MSRIVTRFVLTCLCCLPLSVLADDGPVVPLVSIKSAATVDPDDMCFHQAGDNSGWIIVSDKSAGAILLFDETGRQLDSVAIPKPGNIDIRNVNRSGQLNPLVVVNQREPRPQLRVLTIETNAHSEPNLRLVDCDLPTGPNNYGGCLYHSAIDGQTYFFSTTKTEGGKVQQFLLNENSNGKFTHTRVRAWYSPICEAAVADDAAGVVFVGEEQVGIRKLGAQPNDPTDGRLILKVGQHGVTGDIEGLTLYRTGPKTGFLIASDQGRDCFVVLDRVAPHRYLGQFQVKGARHTDGIDVAPFSLGKIFSGGAFACHTDGDDGKRILLSPLANVIQQFAK